MLNIILLLLKILGITILVILGIIILLVCILLFVPLRYKVIIGKNNNNTSVNVKANISFLLHFLNIHIEYPSQKMFRIRIMFFELKSKKDKASKIKNNNRKSKHKENDVTLYKSTTDNINAENNIDIEANINTDDCVDESSNKHLDINTSEKKPDLDLINDKDSCLNKDKTNSKNYDVNIDDDDEKTSIKDFVFKIIDLIKNFKNKFDEAINKFNDIKNNYEYYKKILTSESFKRGYDLVKKKLIKIIKIIIPKKIRGYIEYGSVDKPDSVGEIYGIYSLIYPWINKKIIFIPNFTGNTLVIDLKIKGYIQLYGLLYALAVVYFNKNIRRLIKLFKKEKINGRK